MAAIPVDVTQDNARVEVRQITLPETYPVRRAVLYPNGPESKIHVPNDESGIHFGAVLDIPTTPPEPQSISKSIKDTEIVAAISLFREPLPAHLSLLLPSSHASRSLRFRKFACLERYQSQGIGKQVFQHVLEFAQDDAELGAGTIVWCDARWSTRDWYLRRGMSVLGEKFYKGDIEYTVMAIQI